MSIEDTIRKMEKQTRCTMDKGTPENYSTKNERALLSPAQDMERVVSYERYAVTTRNPAITSDSVVDCKGNVKAGLPANFESQGIFGTASTLINEMTPARAVVVGRGKKAVVEAVETMVILAIMLVVTMAARKDISNLAVKKMDTIGRAVKTHALRLLI
ncbi:hypothetical protein L914_04251 [Phytophthora nicotianae]|uniref:Uncharacterized protein n=1 Tax=Phytophthora nicotianae TaxID=4792 RepID=W2NVM6_PHYNI|nr:hypothetical protein L914_04251 [Phytophthora nicotianae]